MVNDLICELVCIFLQVLPAKNTLPWKQHEPNDTAIQLWDQYNHIEPNSCESQKEQFWPDSHLCNMQRRGKSATTIRAYLGNFGAIISISCHYLEGTA
jgi:hypothetical protein